MYFKDILTQMLLEKHLVYGSYMLQILLWFHSSMKKYLCAMLQISSVKWGIYYRRKLDSILILFEMTDDWLQHTAKAEIWISDFLSGHLSLAQLLYDI